jgi:hypothetical protein
MAKFASIGACSKKPLIEARSHHGQSFVGPVAIEEGSVETTATTVQSNGAKLSIRATPQRAVGWSGG